MGLTYHFRFGPWDVDRLTVEEFTAYCSALDHIGEGVK